MSAGGATVKKAKREHQPQQGAPTADRKRKLKVSVDTPYGADVHVPWVEEGKLEAILAVVSDLYGAGMTVAGCNAIVKHLPQNLYGCVVLATRGITPPHLTSHLVEAAALAQCPVCAVTGLTSEMLGKAVGLKKCMAVAVKLDADPNMCAPILGMSSSLSLPWVKLVPTYEDLKLAVTESKASADVRAKRKSRKEVWRQKQAKLKEMTKQQKKKQKN